MLKNSAKTKLAIFDIDGTIFRSSLLIEVINELVDAKIFPVRAKTEMKKDYEAWLNRTGDYGAYLSKVIQIYLRYIKGHTTREMNSTAKKVLKNKQRRVYRFSRDLVRQLEKQGYYLLALSHSPDYIVKPYSKFLGFKEFYGSEYTVKNGVYTGGVNNFEYLRNKSLVLKMWLEKNKHLNVDLKNSIAVGDTESDIPLLKMVGKPVAFNPNSGFAKHAQKSGWKIVVERKDVIYDVQKFKFVV